MQQMIATIPDRAFEYHTSQNHLSKWLYSRGLFPLASSIRQYNKSHFSSVEEHRRVLVGLIRDYRTLLGQGVVARFDTETYSDAVALDVYKRQELDREEQYARCLAHLQQKYAEGGYLRLWIAESENARRLEELRGVIRDPQRLRKMFDAAFDTETAE